MEGPKRLEERGGNKLDLDQSPAEGAETDDPAVDRRGSLTAIELKHVDVFPQQRRGEIGERLYSSSVKPSGKKGDIVQVGPDREGSPALILEPPCEGRKGIGPICVCDHLDSRIRSTGTPALLLTLRRVPAFPEQRLD